MCRSVGEWLKEVGFNIIRLRGAMSQGELADKAGLSRSTIQAAEAGQPVMTENLVKIAIALGKSPADLFMTREDAEQVSAQTVWLLKDLNEMLEKMRKALKA